MGGSRALQRPARVRTPGTAGPAAETRGHDTRTRIVREAIALFADAGFTGASMRDVAQRVGISAPTLYHHFPDKQALHAAALAHAFASARQAMAEALERELPPAERLRNLVDTLAALAARDETFRKLVLREMLDGDEQRIALLATQVFGEPYRLMVRLARELASDLDPYLLVNSLVGMVLFGIQSAPLRRHLPGVRRRKERPADIAHHVATLLERAGGRAQER